MIKYSLRCSDGHNFEAWFSSSKAYEDQTQDSLVLCPLCDSREIKKNIMSPNIGKKGNKSNTNNDVKKIEVMMNKVRKHVEKNYEYVGKKFPEEARAMHYEEKESKDIYGESSIEEAKELIEEGIDIHPIPGINKKTKN
ncbi:MAG: hypothetical protein CML96_02640 [Rhodobiaceae bacterium]|jgi:hypothetical protein|nr:hypothetical protein [Rhodobiaceae bacterium]|tara:strand:- start:1081 stop:1497 length:417 start_codon:yes stop_codon:yes gene_type:complete